MLLEKFDCMSKGIGTHQSGIESSAKNVIYSKCLNVFDSPEGRALLACNQTYLIIRVSSISLVNSHFIKSRN